METPKIFDSELRFCEILWSHEPVKSSELVRLCAEELGWKKSTTYTVIKRLAERGVVHTENAVVTSRVARSRFASVWSTRRSKAVSDPLPPLDSDSNRSACAVTRSRRSMSCKPPCTRVATSPVTACRVSAKCGWRAGASTKVCHKICSCNMLYAFLIINRL